MFAAPPPVPVIAAAAEEDDNVYLEINEDTPLFPTRMPLYYTSDTVIDVPVPDDAVHVYYGQIAMQPLNPPANPPADLPEAARPDPVNYWATKLTCAFLSVSGVGILILRSVFNDELSEMQNIIATAAGATYILSGMLGGSIHSFYYGNQCQPDPADPGVALLPFQLQQ